MNSATLTLFQMRFVNKAFWRNPASAFFTFAFPALVTHPWVGFGLLMRSTPFPHRFWAV